MCTILTPFFFFNFEFWRWQFIRNKADIQGRTSTSDMRDAVCVYDGVAKFIDGR